MVSFNTNKHIFFVGIGGIGMSGIAEILLKRGYKVSGSDKELTDLTDYLQQLGATVYEGHAAENIKNVDVLVYSSAVKSDNPERMKARQEKIPEIRRAEMLAQVIAHQYCIGISGTHGKTTTTSMCGSVLIDGGLDPTLIVGGRVQSLKTNARLGNGDFVIVEADEYDRSFLALQPTIAVVTSIEADHLDCYENIDDLKNTFTEYVNKTPFYGSIICCADEPQINEIMPNFNKKCTTYGISKQSRFRAEDISFTNNQSIFNAYDNNELMGSVALNVPGIHNVKNALAAIAVGMDVGISFNKIKLTLEGFSGVERRFEVKAVVNDIMIVDDYAHHPTEVQATINAAQNGWNKRIIAVFQPHLYSRTRDFFREFAQSLSKADVVVLTDVYPAREKPISGVNGEIIARAVKDLNHEQVHYIGDKSELPEFLHRFTKANDMVITIGAGDIWKAGHKLIELIKNN